MRKDDIICINSVIATEITEIPKRFPKAVLVDPVTPASLSMGQIFSHKENKLKVNHFSNLCSILHEWRIWFNSFLERGGLLVVFLRPYCTLEHDTQIDLQLGNYDWLWEGAGQDTKLHITAQECEDMDILEYGYDAPFSSYLQQKWLYSEATARGSFHTMAVNQMHKAVAFLLPYKKGKIVFLPRCKGEDAHKALLHSIFEALQDECWPSLELIKDIKPAWISSYVLSESEYLENRLSQLENQIQQLEEECEQVHERLGHLSQIRNSLFGGTLNSTASALATMFVQWGVEIYPQSSTLELVSGDKHAICLPVVTSGRAELWVGKKLSSLLPESHKGFLVVNSYRLEKPTMRPNNWCSPALVEYAKKHHFCIFSMYDVFNFHCQGDKTLLQRAWETDGILNKAVN